MKLLRTVRLDPSDTFVFAEAAPAGEWAVAGGFMFWDGDPAALSGKQRAAFRSGFLGVASGGWSTLVEVAEATEAERAAAVSSLAALLVARCGAPDLERARAAAEEEIAFAASLCDPPAGTVIALQRTIETEGEVRERFRTLRPTLQPDGNQFGQGCVLPIGIAREEEVEEVDIVGLMGASGREGRR